MTREAHSPPPPLPQTLVYGLGRSGRGVLRFLAREGVAADWFDNRPSAEDLDLAAQFGFSPADLSRPYRSVVAAPGVPIDHPDLERLRAGGAEIIGEAELAARARPNLPVVGVTGTAGKGGTTVLIASLLRACGLNAREGGNIDPPLLDIIDEAEVAVAELSSFQLERVVRFAPAVAVITNLGVDHLDRHGSVEAYHAAKRNIARAQGSGDWLVLPPEVEVPTRARVLRFDPQRIALSDGTRLLGAADLPEGIHPANAAAAVLAAEAMLRRLGRPVDPAALQSALRQARPMKGRFETVARRGELRFVNDSIATRSVAVEAALLQAAPPIAWLVGGRDKGAELGPLRRAAEGKVQVVVAFGQDGETLARALGLPTLQVPFSGQGGEATMRQAVQLAAEALGERGTVLLAPIGTSFDLYRDYAERGEAFAAAARAWTQAHVGQEVGR
ncbi:UDP-N-acetylmuramoyl-L-alanine--D-glutamate ligase [Deinococcus irradiatisoli]|uniref:UDP-N-acetylmuramoylalanine--D-glutamate ligase n=1 Tax=Deinococcus irradiatisoli TaxID=2202254 RepID=A0A2Z3JGU6_9DEIO|nr:UDP-N-acetylmuramoyl-L-alanine--D-glutamate ligase [Deinococcus irradiatisoli]AWN22570.1 UDP-N-acetylmuramoyl-L-alanine--D-glutamate ligase [Deinococcus irradiatisoli]